MTLKWPLMSQRVRYLKKFAIELVFPAKVFCIENLTENKSQIVCILYANYVAFQIMYKRGFIICCRRPKDAVSIVFNKFVKGIYISGYDNTSGNPSAHYRRIPPHLHWLIWGPHRGRPPCRAANMEIVIGYYWLLSSKSLQIKPLLN
jgi:hypothetical protein